MTLVSVTAYHSFGGEVEASNTPTIRRLTPSCRHQLPRIARLKWPASQPDNTWRQWKTCSQKNPSRKIPYGLFKIAAIEF
jgi:hypothetical protein